MKTTGNGVIRHQLAAKTHWDNGKYQAKNDSHQIVQGGANYSVQRTSCKEE